MNHVLITGAAGNLGLTVTKMFLKNNWNVTALTKDSIESNVLESTFVDYSSTLTIYNCDVTIEEQVKQIFELLNLRPFSAVVHLVGGISAGQPINETPVIVFEEMLTLNTLSTFLLISKSVEHFKKNEIQGSIITIGAKDNYHQSKNRSAYAASKAAVQSLTLTAAEEGKEYGIRSNIILPGIIRTPANLAWAENGEESKWTDPKSIANTIFYLATPVSKGVTGTVIEMYGQLPA